jgi:putative transcription antitermination factor YqgF
MKKKLYLGLDYGQAWIGVAIGSKEIGVSALKPINLKGKENSYAQINKVCGEYEIDVVVMGLSRGRLEEEMKNFGEELENYLEKKVILADEFGSSRQALSLAKNSHISTRKIKNSEHSLAAAEILRQYLSQI